MVVSLIVLAVAVAASADVSRDGRLVLGSETILSGGRLAHVTIWDLSSGRVVRVLAGGDEPLFSRDGHLVVGMDGNSTAVIFDSTSGGVMRTIHSRAWLMNPAFSPNGRLVVALDGEPAVLEPTAVGIWSTATGRRLRTFGCGDDLNGHCESAELSPNGRDLLASGTDRTAQLWDVRTGRLVRTFSAGPSPDGFPAFSEARFSRDGRLVVLELQGLNGGESVRVYDAANGKARFALAGASDASLSLASTRLATHKGRQTIRVHDARSGRLLKTFHDPRGAAGDLVFSSDGSRLFSYADSFSSKRYGWSFNALRIWDIAHGTVLHTIRTPFSTAQYSPNGNLLVTIGPTLQVWDAETGQLLRTLHR